MSGISYDPPTEDLPIYDSSVFLAQVLATQSHVATNYVQYPNAQGTETFPDIVVSGTSTLHTTTTGLLTATNTGGGRQLQIRDSVNSGASFILNNGNQLAINSVTDTSIPVSLFQTALLLQTRDPANGGVVLLNGNSTAMTIGNATTLTLAGGNTLNALYTNINLNSTSAPQTTGGMPIFNDASNKIPTTTWVQSAISGGIALSSQNVHVASDNTAADYYIPFVKNTALLTPDQPMYVDDTTTKLTYNPSLSQLTCTTLAGALIGNATSSSASVVAGISTGTMYIAGVSNPSTGIWQVQTDVGGHFTYQPATNAVSLGAGVNGSLAITGSASTLSVAGAGQAIACPNATDIQFPLATVTALAFNGLASKATTVSVISDNTAGTYYIPFAKTTALLSSSQQLYIDDTTGPLTYNASTGGLACASITLTTGMALPTTALTSTFSAGALSVSGGSLSQRNSTITFTGAVAQFITTLTMLGPLTNGIYYVTILNIITGTLTVNTGLGANIKTKYSAAVVIPAGATALMTINVLLVGAVATTIVDCYSLT